MGSGPSCKCFWPGRGGDRPYGPGQATPSLSFQNLCQLEDGSSDPCVLGSYENQRSRRTSGPPPGPCVNDAVNRASRWLGEVGPEGRLGAQVGLGGCSFSQRSSERPPPSVLGPATRHLCRSGVGWCSCLVASREPVGESPPEVFGPQDLPPSPKVAPVLWTQGPKRASREQLRALPSPRAREGPSPASHGARRLFTRPGHTSAAGPGVGVGMGGQHVLREKVFHLDSPEKSLWPGTATQTESSGSWGLSSGVSPGR